MNRSSPAVIDLSAGYAVLPGYVDAAGLEKARAAAAGLPAWEEARDASSAQLLAETFALEGAEVFGAPLTRRALMMGLGPAQASDRAQRLWGRRARCRADAADLFTAAADALGPGARALSVQAEAVYPGADARPEGRATAEPWAHQDPDFAGARAILLLDDVAPGDGALLVWPGSHTAEPPRGAAATRGVFRETLRQEPLEISGSAGTLVLFHPRVLRAETRRAAVLPARRLSALLGVREPSPPPPPPPPASGPTVIRRILQFAKLSVLFPLSRRLRAPLRMVNVGAGKQWQHPSVIALDVDPETNLNQDVTQTGLPFPDASMDAVYSSHCLEHLMPGDAAGFFIEARRVLRPGGTLRIVCPDMDKLFDAYERRDQEWFDWCADSFYSWDGWLRAIGRMAATMVVDRFSDEELAKLYREGGRRGFCDALAAEQARLSAADVAPWPDAHKSWWTRPKLAAALREAGFREVVDSARDGSRVPTFRDPRYFDYSSPSMSLYVECVK